MLNEIIKSINDDLDKYKDLTHEQIFTTCIETKLRNTLLNYNYDIDLNSKFLLTRQAEKVLKAITKIQMKDNREAILNSVKQKENKEND